MFASLWQEKYRRNSGLPNPARDQGKSSGWPRTGLTKGSRLFGDIVPNVYAPVLAKHTKNFGLQDSISIGVDRMQCNFEPMHRQVEAWRTSQLSDEAVKLVI